MEGSACPTLFTLLFKDPRFEIHKQIDKGHMASVRCYGKRSNANFEASGPPGSTLGTHFHINLYGDCSRWVSIAAHIGIHFSLKSPLSLKTGTKQPL